MFGLNKNNISGQVDELLQRLKTDVDLTDEQATKVLDTMKAFIVEKYPMLSGAVDSMFGGK